MDHNFITRKIRERTREEWEALVWDWFMKTRSWIQDHGEWALGLGVVGGIIMVLFLKGVMLVVVLCALAAGVVWFLSHPEARLPAGYENPLEKDSSPGDGPPNS